MDDVSSNGKFPLLVCVRLLRVVFAASDKPYGRSNLTSENAAKTKLERFTVREIEVA